MDGAIGKLEIILRPVEVSDELAQRLPGLKAGPYAKLTVLDDGPGMDDETLKHVYDPFFTTKDVGKGTGMGLSMVHGIVTKRGGAIEITSEGGKGTKAELYLPLCQLGECGE